ncbi:Hypothetical predicted protein [Pelobates cultripes]|uniref:Uncharacterized protein n=2 Tax=Pelobates cultripes TaxID=61616 RepID=A0AAD1SPW8_PELCU|nr:Hypothetical predicted protein [Pelobates cultripes]
MTIIHLPEPITQTPTKKKEKKKHYKKKRYKKTSLKTRGHKTAPGYNYIMNTQDTDMAQISPTTNENELHRRLAVASQDPLNTRVLTDRPSNIHPHRPLKAETTVKSTKTSAVSNACTDISRLPAADHGRKTYSANAGERRDCTPHKLKQVPKLSITRIRSTRDIPVTRDDEQPSTSTSGVLRQRPSSAACVAKEPQQIHSLTTTKHTSRGKPSVTSPGNVSGCRHFTVESNVPVKQSISPVNVPIQPNPKKSRSVLQDITQTIGNDNNIHRGTTSLTSRNTSVKVPTHPPPKKSRYVLQTITHTDSKNTHIYTETTSPLDTRKCMLWFTRSAPLWFKVKDAVQHTITEIFKILNDAALLQCSRPLSLKLYAASRPFRIGHALLSHDGRDSQLSINGVIPNIILPRDNVSDLLQWFLRELGFWFALGDFIDSVISEIRNIVIVTDDELRQTNFLNRFERLDRATNAFRSGLNLLTPA